VCVSEPKLASAKTMRLAYADDMETMARKWSGNGRAKHFLGLEEADNTLCICS